MAYKMNTAPAYIMDKAGANTMEYMEPCGIENKDSYLFGYYQNRKCNSPSKKVSFDWAYNQITTNEELGAIPKSELPAVTFATSSPRIAGAAKEWNRIVAYNIDHIEAEEISRIKDLLKNEAALIYVTPSGRGLRVVFVCETEDFARTWTAGRNYLQSMGIEVDEKCKDIERLSFLSYDPGAICNIEEGCL